MRIRRAVPADLPALMALERACFARDVQTRRSMAHLIARAHGEVRVVDDKARLIAHLVLLYRRGTRVARIYSIAVDPASRGRGLARWLIEDAERCALTAGCVRISAEARSSNHASRTLFAACGYRETAELADYYEGENDGFENGVRLVKALLSETTPGSP